MLNLNLNWVSEAIKSLKDWWPVVKSNFQQIQDKHNALESRVDTIITTPIDGQAAAQELVDARGGKPTLGARLDEFNSQLADSALQIDNKVDKVTGKGLSTNDFTNEDKAALEAKADKVYVDAQIASVADGTPEAFPNLAAIQAAYPNGDTHVKLNLEDGYVYKWNSEAWVQGWLYQSSGIAENAVKIRNIATDLTTVILGKEIRPAWEYGTFDANGNPAPGTSRIRTAGFIVPTNDIEILFLNSESYKYGIRVYDMDGNYIWGTPYLTKKKDYYYKGYKYKILMAKADDSNIESVSDLANNIIIHEIAGSSIPFKDLDNALLKVLSQYTGFTKNYSYHWELGVLYAADGGINHTIFYSGTRIYTPEISYAEEDITIINTDSNLYKYAVFYFDSSGTYLSSKVWLFDSMFVIPAGSYYKLMLAYANDASMTSDTMPELYTKFAFLGGEVHKNSTEIVSSAVNVLENYSSLVPVHWVRGNIRPNEPPIVNDAIKTRITVADLQYADEDILLTNADSSLYKFGVLTYDPTGTTMEQYNAWKQYDRFFIPRGTYFRLIGANADDSNILDVNDLASKFTLLKAPKNIVRDTSYISHYWVRYLNEKIDTIRNLQLSGGPNKFSFVVIADIHWQANNKRSPGLIKKILKDCKINYIVQPGDFTSDGVAKDVALKNMREVISVFTSLGGLFLPTMGNHDDNSYHSDPDLNMLLSNTITRDEQYSEVYRHLGNNVVYGDSGTYYYIDDNFHKIRIISLDCLDMSYANDGTGKMAYKAWGYRQTQLEWLCNVALNVPDDTWSVIPFTHIPPYTSAEMVGTGDTPPYNSDVLMGALEAFKAKTSYNKTITNGNDYDINIDVDFSGKGGNVVALVCGHCHNDHLLYWNDNIPVITTLNDGTHLVPPAPQKVTGTTTEQAFDVFTVDKANRKVYVTRIGAGESREFTY